MECEDGEAVEGMGVEVMKSAEGVKRRGYTDDAVWGKKDLNIDGRWVLPSMDHLRLLLFASLSYHTGHITSHVCFFSHARKKTSTPGSTTARAGTSRCLSQHLCLCLCTTHHRSVAVPPSASSRPSWDWRL